MQGSLPAGWLAFTGRASTPLDHNKRFQITHPPFLDLSWRKGSFMMPLDETLVTKFRRPVYGIVTLCRRSAGALAFGSPVRLPHRVVFREVGL
jgi:hypothetical protein